MKVSKLPKLLPGIHPSLPEGPGDPEVLGVTHDSRRVRPGWVFVAIKGHQRDGTDFAADAVGRGAVAVVAERKITTPPSVPVFIVPDARRALGALASAFFGRPSRQLKVIGITGTNGKTTTAMMVRSIVEAAGERCGVLGTIVYDTGRQTLPASITTPESVDIQEFLAEMRDSGMTHAAMEVSSHALCMRRVDFVNFAAGVFTNLTGDHLDYHGTRRNYREAKAQLFRMLGPAAFAVLNADDPCSRSMARATCAEVVHFGLRRKSDYTAAIHESTVDGVRMTLQTPKGRADVRLPLIGQHNVCNTLAAAAATMSIGHGLDSVVMGIERMTQVPGRLEAVPCEAGFKVFVDFAHTDQALASVLTSLRRLAPKRILVVFGAGGDRDRAKRPRMGGAVERGADLAWVTNDNPRSEDPRAIIDDILAGVADRRRFRVQPDRQAAIAEALDEARDGDLVLIAGKGHERTQRFRDTVIPFDDRDAVRRALPRAAPAERIGA